MIASKKLAPYVWPVWVVNLLSSAPGTPLLKKKRTKMVASEKVFLSHGCFC